MHLGCCTHTTPRRDANNDALLLAGPTASGKSALALVLARALGGVVVNADSMQVYAELPILTAQPSAQDRTQAPHRLYGHVPAREAYSTGRYLSDVASALDDARLAGLRPIIVGGTGLYFKALLEGLSPVPSVPETVRARWRTAAIEVGAASLWQQLAARDPAMAARLPRGDTQRIVRALEVLDATGRSLADWWQEAGAPLLNAATTVKVIVDRPRAVLLARTDARFDAMMAAGALAEVAALRSQGLSEDLPAMRALGVRPLLRHLEGKLTREDAVAAAKAETRRYVKRQQTWIRRQMASWTRVDTDHETIDQTGRRILLMLKN